MDSFWNFSLFLGEIKRKTNFLFFMPFFPTSVKYCVLASKRATEPWYLSKKGKKMNKRTKNGSHHVPAELNRRQPAAIILDDRVLRFR